MAVDIIYGENVSKGVNAEAKNGLWLSAGDFKRVAGFELKPEGFCKGEQCYPVPPRAKPNSRAAAVTTSPHSPG